MNHSIELADTVCTLKMLVNEVETLARTPSQYSADIADRMSKIATTAIKGFEQARQEVYGLTPPRRVQ